MLRQCYHDLEGLNPPSSYFKKPQFIVGGTEKKSRFKRVTLRIGIYAPIV